MSAANLLRELVGQMDDLVNDTLVKLAEPNQPGVVRALVMSEAYMRAAKILNDIPAQYRLRPYTKRKGLRMQNKLRAAC